MKTIYVLTEGSYSDYGVVAVTPSRAVAEKMEKFGHGSIEEFPLLETEDDLVSIPYYNVKVDMDGNEISRHMTRFTNWQYPPQSMMFNTYSPRGTIKFPVAGICIWTTKSYEHGLKAARDILAVFKNEFGDRRDFPVGMISDWFNQVAKNELD
jgi:hypothetical protein